MFQKNMGFPSLQETLTKILPGDPIAVAKELGYQRPTRPSSTILRASSGQSIGHPALCDLAGKLGRIPLLLYADGKLLPGRAYEIAAGQITDGRGELLMGVFDYFAKASADAYVTEILRARWQQNGNYEIVTQWATRAGVSTNKLSSWMCGVARPSTGDLVGFCKATGLEVQWLPHVDVLIDWQHRLPAPARDSYHKHLLPKVVTAPPHI